jgi:hypothetical protein
MVGLAAKMQEMSARDLHELRGEVSRWRREVQEEIEAAIARNMQERQAVVQRMQHEAQHGMANCVSSALFQCADLRAVCELLGSEEFQRLSFDQDAASAGSAPAPPSPAQSWKKTRAL